MLECLELRRQSAELRQELSHALYKEDAAMRVLARVSRERDEAREALASVKATLGPAYQGQEGGAADAQMEGVEEQAAEGGLPADAKKRVEETHETCVGHLSLALARVQRHAAGRALRSRHCGAAG